MASSSKDSKIIEYKDLIAQQKEIIKNQQLLIDTLNGNIASMQDTIANLNEKVDYLTKKLFGTSSEKISVTTGQLSLLEDSNVFDEAEQIVAESPNVDVTVKEHTRKAKSTHEEIFKGIPVIEEIIPLPDNEKFCQECGTKLIPIGKEFIRDEFHYIPAKGILIKLYRETYKCPTCSNASQMAENIKFVKAHVPEALIPNSYASSSVIAWTIYEKYAKGMPLYRQEMAWKQLGAGLNRATLANWMIHCAKEYFKPMYDFFHRKLLLRKFLMADETRVQVLHEPERKAETDSFMWLFRTGEDGEPTILLYKYTETRAKFNAVAFLDGFTGYLETDAYQGYNNLPGITRCCCWAHMKRYFHEAVPKDHKDDLNEPALQGELYCSKLFEYERISKEKQPTFEQRKEFRLQKEKPVLDAFWLWLSKQKPRKNSKFDKAVNYALNHQQELMNYLEDGRCSLSNNLSENAIRPFTVGRKNWLFSDTPKGAEASAILYTMVEMAKAHNIKIFDYCKYVLDHRPDKNMTDDELEKLAPWNKDVIEKCKFQ